MMFLVRCPQCKHEMKYATVTPLLAGKKKKCVYCPRSFSVKDAVVKAL